MTLTLADANRVIAGAIEKANQIGAKMNIAVCDAGGRLLAFQRMDGAMWAGSFGRPSGDLTPRADHPTLRGIAAAEGNHIFYGQGAMPIFRQGVLIGACGVGGGTAQEDEDCARAGQRPRNGKARGSAGAAETIGSGDTGGDCKPGSNSLRSFLIERTRDQS